MLSVCRSYGYITLHQTIADNIELLRDVLRTQRKLIRENVNEDLSKVPRMIALYKEVEAFFYGDETTQRVDRIQGAL